MRHRRIAALAALALLSGCGRTEPHVSRAEAGGPDGSLPDVCTMEISPGSVDFGDVPLGTQKAATLTLENVSTATCDVVRLVVGEGSDFEFALVFPPATPFSLEPGETRHVDVAFDARSHDLPRERFGNVVAVTTAEDALETIPLRARILVGCDLAVAPAVMDFGSVRLNKETTASVVLANQGDAPCEVSDLALAPGSDRLFSIPGGQPTRFTVPAGGAMPLMGAFSARDSAEPHERAGTMTFTRSQPSGLPATPAEELEVPLRAFIDTVCHEGSQWIYTVDQNGQLAIFNPEKLAYEDVGPLSCPGTWATPFSMAIDQNTVAWVEYTDGQLFRVDARTAACTSTSFVQDSSVSNFGMGFVYDPDTGEDTLYIAGGYGFGAIPSTLATIAFPSLEVTRIAPIDFGAPELTGTGDGELWGFAPSFNSASGVTTLAHVDRASGRVLASVQLPGVMREASSYAMAFWGGSFWLFLGDSVYQVPRKTLQATQVMSYTGRNIVGVGVSTCAPLD